MEQEQQQQKRKCSSIHIDEELVNLYEQEKSQRKKKELWDNYSMELFIWKPVIQNGFSNRLISETLQKKSAIQYYHIIIIIYIQQ